MQAEELSLEKSKLRAKCMEMAVTYVTHFHSSPVSTGFLDATIRNTYAYMLLEVLGEETEEELSEKMTNYKKDVDIVTVSDSSTTTYHFDDDDLPF